MRDVFMIWHTRHFTEFDKYKNSRLLGEMINNTPVWWSYQGNPFA